MNFLFQYYNFHGFFKIKLLAPLIIIYLFIYLFIWLCWVFVSVQGLPLVAASGGHSSLRCAGLSLSWSLLLQSTGFRRTGSVVVAHGPSCSAACGILPDQGSNPCPLHQQADSQPLCHQGSPSWVLMFSINCIIVTCTTIKYIIYILYMQILICMSIHCNNFSFLCQNCTVLGLWEPFRLAPVSFLAGPHPSLLSEVTCPRLGSSYIFSCSFMEPWFLLLGMFLY